MEIIKRGFEEKKRKVYKFKCRYCRSIFKARDDDSSLEYDTSSKTQFHFVCPVCGARPRIWVSDEDQCEITLLDEEA